MSQQYNRCTNRNMNDRNEAKTMENGVGWRRNGEFTRLEVALVFLPPPAKRPCRANCLGCALCLRCIASTSACTASLVRRHTVLVWCNISI